MVQSNRWTHIWDKLTRYLSEAVSRTGGVVLPVGVAVVLSGVLTGCATENTPDMLTPRGPAAAHVAELWWILFWAATAVFVLVLGLCVFAILRSGNARPDEPVPLVARNSFIVGAGAIVPALILIGVLAVTVRASNVLMDRSEPPALTIEVIAHQWWWEVRYPDHGIVTANEIYMPAGVPVEFHLTARDVIHSFWVPQLAGKLDMIDGKIHTARLEAWEPGTFRGICAEFCGVQHTFMDFYVVAQEPAEFQSWVEQQQRPHAGPTTEAESRGMEIYYEARCDQCHIVRGFDEPMPPTGRAGPDLTHLGSRMTLAGATIENNVTTLAQWILDPHTIKPGVHMLPTPLEPDELDALVAFLLAME